MILASNLSAWIANWIVVGFICSPVISFCEGSSGRDSVTSDSNEGWIGLKLEIYPFYSGKVRSDIFFCEIWFMKKSSRASLEASGSSDKMQSLYLQVTYVLACFGLSF